LIYPEPIPSPLKPSQPFACSDEKNDPKFANFYAPFITIYNAERLKS